MAWDGIMKIITLTGIVPLIIIAIAMVQDEKYFIAEDTHGTKTTLTLNGAEVTMLTDQQLQIGIFVSSYKASGTDSGLGLSVPDIEKTKGNFEKIDGTMGSSNQMLPLIFPNCKYEGKTHLTAKYTNDLLENQQVALVDITVDDTEQAAGAVPATNSEIEDLITKKDKMCHSLKQQQDMVYAAVAFAVLLVVLSVTFLVKKEDSYDASGFLSLQAQNWYMLVTTAVLTGLTAAISYNAQTIADNETAKRKIVEGLDVFPWEYTSQSQSPSDSSSTPGKDLFTATAVVSGALLFWSIVVLGVALSNGNSTREKFKWHKSVSNLAF